MIKPEVFISKSMIPVYLLIIVYIFFAPVDNLNPESRWFTRRILPIYTGISLYTYYFNYSNDFKGMRVIFWFTFIIILISCLTTLLGLEKYPVASRELASSVYGDLKMTSNYYKLGITGYGFITSLAYVIPIIVLFFQERTWKQNKFLYLLAGLLTGYTVIKAQYATQFLLFSMALLLSLLGLTLFNRHKLLIILSVVLLIILPHEFYSNSLYSLADIIPGNILKERLFDIGTTIEGDDFSDVSHTEARLKRLPFLLNEFINNPITGGGRSTGHVFWLDHLSLYGIIGFFPWIMLILVIYKRMKLILNTTLFYYQVALAMFILLGFMKGSGSREQLIILFFILPSGLILYEKNVLFKNKRNFNSVPCE